MSRTRGVIYRTEERLLVETRLAVSFPECGARTYPSAAHPGTFPR